MAKDPPKDTHITPPSRSAPPAGDQPATAELTVTGEQTEQFLLASFGALLVGIAYLLLPGTSYSLGPKWLLLVVEIVFLVPLLHTIFFQSMPHMVARRLRQALQAIMVLALIISLVLLILALPHESHAISLLRPAGVLWISNILIFAQWYWEIDGDGPISRHKHGHKAADFQFPQQSDGKSWPPGFVDYLFLAFCSATALSPADTVPLSRRAKLLMMVQASISLLLIALVISRSVNII